MTAGEHSGRGYGRDDYGHPSRPEQAGGYDPLPDDDSWATDRDQWGEHTWHDQQPQQPQWPPAPSWYARPPAEDLDHRYGGDGYGGDGHWGADPPADQYGHRPGYGEDHTQAFTRPADADWADPGQRYAGTWQSSPEDHRPGARGPRHGQHDDDDGRRRGLPLWQEVPLLLIIAFCLAILVRTFLLQAFYIPSGSMEDTLLAGDRVLVNKLVYHVREPARGEVVVFRGTEDWAPQQTIDTDIGTFAKIGRTLGDLVGIKHPDEKDYIKRIIGLPGDRISCCDVDGRIFVNGQPIDESYVIHNSPLTDVAEQAQDCRNRRFDEVVVEPGQMFVLGDHRAVSQDSRCQGQVPIDNIIGRAFVIVWPSSRWTGLPAPDAFDSVPRAGGAPEPVELAEQPLDLAVLPVLALAALVIRRTGRVPVSSGVGEAVGSRGG